MSPDDQPIVRHPGIHGEVDAVSPVTPTPSMPPPDPQTTSATTTSASDLVAIEQSVNTSAASATGVRTSAPSRAFSLDALRGLFLVLMTAGFTIRGTHFPLWMYHRQMPPPDYAVVPIAGLGWRDLAYGAFLFTMAAAFPLTLSRRVDRGETELAIIFAAIRRYALLLVFALLIGHANSYFIGYTQTARLLAIAGFGVMALIFTRRRPDWDAARFRVLRRAGWGLALAFLAFSPLLYGERFAVSRIDDIISGLAFAALFGSVIWYFTRENIVARLGVLAAVAALHLGASADGWLQQWWHYSPMEWAFVPSRLFLLTVVIPGTIAGDVVLRWMRAPTPAQRGPWSGARMGTLAALGFAFTPLLVVGLYNRAVLLTTQATVAMVIGGLFLVARPTNPTERMLRSLFLWGSAWLVLGLLLEPFEGGIKKVPETLSYFVVVAGITTMLLVALTALVDGMGRQKSVQTLIDVGHNPLLMYVVFSVLMNSALEMIPPLRGVLRNSAGEVLLRTLLETAAAILLVRYATRRRIFWRT